MEQLECIRRIIKSWARSNVSEPPFGERQFCFCIDEHLRLSLRFLAVVWVKLQLYLDILRAAPQSSGLSVGFDHTFNEIINDFK